jgi:hypothetical protein
MKKMTKIYVQQKIDEDEEDDAEYLPQRMDSSRVQTLSLANDLANVPANRVV